MATDPSGGFSWFAARLAYFRSLGRVLGFKSALNDPWQEEAREDFDEQFTKQNLEQNVSIYSSTLSIVNTSRYLMGAKMVYPITRTTAISGNTQQEEDFVKNHFVLQYLVTKRRRRLVTCALQLLATILTLYVSYDMSSAMMTLFENDQLLQDLNHEASRLARASERSNLKRLGCLSGQNLSKHYVDTIGKLGVVGKELDSYGVAIRSQIGINFLLMSILAPLASVDFVLTCWHAYQNDQMRADSLAMVLTPLEARKFNQAQVEAIFATLRMQLLDQIKLSELGAGSTSPHSDRPESYPRGTSCSTEPLQTVKKQNERRRKLLRLLDELSRGRLVRPCTHSFNWLYGLIHIHHISKASFNTEGKFIVSSALTYMNLFEAYNCLAQHLAEMRCERVGQVSLFHQRAPIPVLSQTDWAKLEQFLNREPTLYETIYLVLSMELGYVLPDARYLIHLFEVLFLCLVLTALGIWWIATNIPEYSFHVTQLVQVRAQLESIRRSLAADSATRASDEINLESKLLISYLNFQIFLRRYGSFHELKHLVMMFGFSMATWTFTMLYLVASRLETDNRTMIIGVSFGIMSFINVILFTASHASRVLRDIMKNLVTVLFVLNQHEPELSRESLVVDLWRRQLLSEAEVIHFTATRLLGVNITHTKLIAINVNFVGLCMMMLGFQAHFQQKNKHLQIFR